MNGASFVLSRVPSARYRLGNGRRSVRVFCLCHAARVSGVDGAATFERSAEGDLIGVFEISANG